MGNYQSFLKQKRINLCRFGCGISPEIDHERTSGLVFMFKVMRTVTVIGTFEVVLERFKINLLGIYPNGDYALK